MNEMVENSLYEDMNVPRLLSILHANTGDTLREIGNILGILQQDPEAWFKGAGTDDSATEALINTRNAAKKAKNWAEADRIRNELKSQGIMLEDKPDGTTGWRRA